MNFKNLFSIIQNCELCYDIKNLITLNLNNLNTDWYIIEPDYKKSVCEQQSWINTLSNGKTVTILVNNVYRWGSFYIKLDPVEKEDISELDEINLDNYDYELIETWDGGCDFWVETKDEDLFNNEEQDQIEELIYRWKGEVPDDEDDDDEDYSEEKLIVNGWSESDCTYIITTKCKLEHSDGPY